MGLLSQSATVPDLDTVAALQQARKARWID